MPALVLLLGLTGCRLFTDTTPHGVVRKYLELVVRGKCDDAWKLVAALRRTAVETEFQRSGARLGVARVEDMYCRPRQGNPYANMVPHSIELHSSNETEAEVWVDTTDGTGKWLVYVVKEGSAWRIDRAHPP